MNDSAGAADSRFWGDTGDAEALERYRTLVNTIDDGICQLDAEDRFVAVNDGILAFTNTTRADLLGEHASSLFDLDGDASTLERELDRLRKNPTEGSELLECTVRTPEGERVRCELRLTPLVEDETVRGTIGVVRDVTERERAGRRSGERDRRADRKRARERDRKLERYERIVENLPVGVYRNTPGPDGEFVTGNARLASIFDADSVEELSEHAVSDLYPDPDRRAEFSRQLERDGAVEDFELEQRTLDGERIWISVTAIRTEEDGDVYFDGIVQDVTERRRRERELDRVLRALGAAREGISLLDEDGEFVYVNDAYASTFGYEPAEMIGEHWDDLGIEADPDRFYDDVLPSLAAEGQWTGTSTGVRSDGTTFLAQHSLTHTEDDELICVVRDVTERRTREENLRKAREQLEVATSAGSVGIWTWDVREDVLTADEYLVETYGVNPAEATTGAPMETFYEPIHEEDEARIRARLERAVEETGEFEATYRIRDADGDSRWVEARGAVEYDGGEPVRVNGAISDVTERTRREQRSEFLETLNHALQPLTDPDEIMTTAARLLGEHLDVDRCTYARVEDDEDHFRVIDDYTRGDTPSMEGRWRLSAFGDAVYRRMRRNRVCVIEDVETDDRIGSADRKPYEQSRIRSSVCVPLHKDGQFVSTMAVHQRIPRRWQEHEIELVTAVAHRCWESLQRARTMRDLRESEERLRLALDAAALGVWELDLQTGTSPVRSPQHDRIFGYREPLEEWNLELFLEHVHPDDRDRVKRRFEEAFETGKWEYECRIFRADGERRWIAAEGEFYHDRDGTPIRAVGIVQDITEEKEREQYLRDAKLRLEAATEAGAVGTWEWHIPDDRIVAGPSLARTFGIDPDAAAEGVPPERFASAIHEDDRERVKRELEDAIDDRAEFEAEYRVRNAEDELRWVVARGHVECDEDGTPVTLPGALTDITERKVNQRKLEESERRYRTLAENFPNGAVGVYDDELQFTLIEGAVLGATLPSATDLEGEAVSKIFPEETARSLEPLFRAAIEDGEIGNATTEFDGRNWRVWAAPLRDADDEIFAGLSFTQDITDQVERERRLEELIDRLETSNERLEQFAYAASHDLQEPLRMVSSYLQLIEQRYGDALDEDGVEFLAFAVDGADRMREMIDGLLAYSRVETGGESFEPVDLESVLGDVRDDLQVRIEESGAEITMDPLPRVDGDAGQLRQVFQNLLENAIEYCGNEPPRVHVSAEQGVDEWIISVRDEGIGIDQEETDRIFDVFQSLHTPEDHSGTGIGLALCERIVERHGGDIWVESTPGSGSTFTFTIPVER